MNAFSRGNALWNWMERVIVSACMITIAVTLLASVTCRHLNIVMVGAEEIAQFAIVWLTFWGMAHCARKSSHIIMSAVLDRCSTDSRKRMAMAICLVSGLFCLVLSGYALDLTQKVFVRGQVTPALRVPIWYMYASAPAGFFLTGIYYLSGFLRHFREPGMFFGPESVD